MFPYGGEVGLSQTSAADETPTLTADAATGAVTSQDQAELENARRRFVLALRMLTVRKESQARSEAMLAQWRTDLERDIARVRKMRRANARRKLVRNAILLTLVVSALFGLHYFQGWMWIVFFMAGAAEVAVNPKRKETAMALARARDPKAVGVLAKAVRDGDPDTKEAAARGLLSILPSLRASDREHIDSDAMDALLSLLPWREGVRAGTDRLELELKLAILGALEQIGDARALPAVRRLQTPPRVTGALLGFVDRRFHLGVRADIDRVCQAAQKCLPYLEERATAERLRDRLLRPAVSPAQGADVLLRPAGGAPVTPDELLLRPAEGADR